MPDPGNVVAEDIFSPYWQLASQQFICHSVAWKDALLESTCYLRPFTTKKQVACNTGDVILRMQTTCVFTCLVKY